MMVLKQFRYYGQGDLRNDWVMSNGVEDLTKNLFSNINGEVIKLGIQAPPDTPFYLNCYKSTGNEIRVGRTGIYELDVDGFTTLQSLVFQANPLSGGDQCIIVDVLYRTLGG